MSTPRVLFVQPILPSYRVPVFRGLVKRGFRVTCWSDHYPRGSLKHVDAGGAFSTAHRFESTLGPFITRPSLIEAASTRDFDVLVLPWNVRYLELSASLLLARARRLPVVLWGHARSKRERSAIRALRNVLGKQATACLTYDTEARMQLISEGFSPERVFAAPNALDVEPSDRARAYWEHHPTELAGWRRERSLVDAPLALFVSRLEPGKRVDLLLKSFARVLTRAPQARLAIVGDGPEREALTQLSDELQIRQRVQFVGAVYDEQELAAWFLSASVFAYPTQIGLSILHAFSYGVPVVTSDLAEAHNPEFIALHPGANGLTYRGLEIDDFAEQMGRCLLDRELQARLSAGARRTVAAPGGYNVNTMLDGMESALRFALGQASRFSGAT
jgi:glycosyltransferase involved in cell wall biosynthesis